jgi:hypothetical protein
MVFLFMSRSRRKSPHCGITTSDTEKLWKRLGNRALRAAFRKVIPVPSEVNGDNWTSNNGLESCDGVIYPVKHEVQSQWGPKDGKQRIDPANHPSLMRK